MESWTLDVSCKVTLQETRNVHYSTNGQKNQIYLLNESSVVKYESHDISNIFVTERMNMILSLN